MKVHAPPGIPARFLLLLILLLTPAMNTWSFLLACGLLLSGSLLGSARAPTTCLG